jgi:hypothetical protein
MQPKSGLNNTQRKMLDEIYMEQFKKKERAIKQKREEGLSLLKEKIIKEESKSKDAKPILEAAKKLAQLVETHKDTMRERGVTVKGIRLDGNIEVDIHTHSYSTYIVHPKIEAYKEDTLNLELELAQKKKEIRALIYGLAATYEEADKEIAEVLKGIKV